MKYVKVLDENLCPPIQGGEPYEIGVWQHCENFDTSDNECAPGFYVIPVSELIHYHRPLRGTKVLPAEIKGSSRIFTAAKQRYEYMKLDNPLSDEEIKKLCKEIEPELGYKLSEALYPVNPLLLPKTAVTDKDIKLLRQWDSVGDSIMDSVRDSVWNSVCDSVWSSVGESVWSSVKDSVKDSVWESVWESVWDSVRSSVGYSVWYSVWNSVRSSVGYSVWESVWDSVRSSVGYSVWNSVRNSVWDSVWNSVWAYIGSLFPSIGKWEYKNHEHSQYPFQSAVNLWYRGLVPSFDGKIWRLHSGEKAEVVWEEPEIGWLKAQEEE